MQISRSGALGLNDDPTASYTLPSAYYLDESIFEQEKNAIFYREWHYVTHVSAIANPGDYATLQIVDENVLLIRDDNGELRGFYNVCRHRAHRLAEGYGHLKRIVCPYHAWAYERDGRLSFARNTQDLKNFDKSRFSLHPVRVEVFMGLVFVNLDENAEPLASKVEGLEQDIRKYIPNFDDLTVTDHNYFGGENGIRANWKVVVDNYVECYHCEKAHPDFSDMIEMPAYQLETFDYWSRQLGLQTKPDNSAYRFDASDDIQLSAFWYLWPTTTINILPGATMVQVLCIQPDGIEKSTFAGHTLSMASEGKSERIDYIFNLLGGEDLALCESVQQGLKSRSYDRGPFVADNLRSGIGEHALHQFHCLVKKALESSVPS